jgi:glycosyltransferase involved in cell wall biosynthesis
MHPDSLSILHCLRAPVGGAFRHVSDLAEAQSAAGHRVGIVCDALTGGSVAADRLAALAPCLALGVTRVAMRRTPSPGDVAVSVRLLRRIAALAPDVLHGHGAKGGAYARLAATLVGLGGRRPIAVYTPHGGSLHFDPATLKGRAVFASERLLRRLGDATVFVSAFEAATYAAKVGAPTGLARVIPNGLRPEEFVPVAPTPDAADLLFIGELRLLKGVDVLIDAAARLAAAGRPVRVVIVGDGPDAARFRADVVRRGLGDAVDFRPPMPIRAALATARAVVMPSRAEALPYVVLETVAAGVPILASRVGGIPEVFAGDDADLLPPGDAAALAAAVTGFLADPDAHRRAAARRRDAIAGRFSLAAMAEATETLYRDARAAARPAPTGAPLPRPATSAASHRPEEPTR